MTKKEQVEYIVKNHHGVAVVRVGKHIAKRGDAAIIKHLQYHVLKEEINKNYEALRTDSFRGWKY